MRKHYLHEISAIYTENVDISDTAKNPTSTQYAPVLYREEDTETLPQSEILRQLGEDAKRLQTAVKLADMQIGRQSTSIVKIKSLAQQIQQNIDRLKDVETTVAALK